MKTEIHPPYFKDATVKCACGAQFVIGSTQESIETEICSQCHPFYTGKEKLVDTAGRIEKFKSRLEKKKALSARKVSPRKKPNKRVKGTQKKKS